MHQHFDDKITQDDKTAWNKVCNIFPSCSFVFSHFLREVFQILHEWPDKNPVINSPRSENEMNCYNLVHHLDWKMITEHRVYHQFGLWLKKFQLLSKKNILVLFETTDVPNISETSGNICLWNVGAERKHKNQITGIQSEGTKKNLWAH